MQRWVQNTAVLTAHRTWYSRTLFCNLKQCTTERLASLPGQCGCSSRSTVAGRAGKLAWSNLVMSIGNQKFWVPKHLLTDSVIGRSSHKISDLYRSACLLILPLFPFSAAFLKIMPMLTIKVVHEEHRFYYLIKLKPKIGKFSAISKF